MRFLCVWLSLAALSFGLPVYAQGDFYSLVNKITQLIINPVIWFLLVLATLIFLWGAVRFALSSGSGDEEGVESGKKHLVWGLVGIFIMLSVKSIIWVIQTLFAGP